MDSRDFLVDPKAYEARNKDIDAIGVVDDKIRIVQAAKAELTGDDAMGYVPHLSFTARYNALRETQKAYTDTLQKMEPHIAAFNALLEESGVTARDYFEDLDNRRRHYNRFLADSQAYVAAAPQADSFKEAYETGHKDRLAYGAMLITQVNLQKVMNHQINVLQQYDRTPLEIKITHVQTEQEASDGRKEVHRVRDLFTGRSSKVTSTSDRELMVTAEITTDAEHARWLMKELTDAGLPVMLTGCI